MANVISPQPLAVGEMTKNNSEQPTNSNPTQSYASQLHQKQSDASKVELIHATVVHGEPTIEFTMDQVTEFIREEGLHQAVVMKFSYGKPELHEIRKNLSSQFDIEGRCNIGQLEYRHLLVRFDLYNDFVKFLSRTIGSMNSKGEAFFFRTFPWTLGFNPKEETSMAVVWISFPGLPLNFFAKRSLLSIASAVGKALAVDKATQERTRPSAARVKVILDLMDKHPNKIKIVMTDKITGKYIVHEQAVVYDNLPRYCTYCKHQGHEQKSCRSLKRQADEDGVEKSSLDVSNVGDGSRKNGTNGHSAKEVETAIDGGVSVPVAAARNACDRDEQTVVKLVGHLDHGIDEKEKEMGDFGSVKEQHLDFNVGSSGQKSCGIGVQQRNNKPVGQYRRVIDVVGSFSHDENGNTQQIFEMEKDMAEIMDKHEGHGNMEKEKERGENGVTLNMPVGQLGFLIEKQDGLESTTCSVGNKADKKLDHMVVKHVGHHGLEKEKHQASNVQQLMENEVGLVSKASIISVINAKVAIDKTTIGKSSRVEEKDNKHAGHPSLLTKNGNQMAFDNKIIDGVPQVSPLGINYISSNSVSLSALDGKQKGTGDVQFQTQFKRPTVGSLAKNFVEIDKAALKNFALNNIPTVLNSYEVNLLDTRQPNEDDNFQHGVEHNKIAGTDRPKLEDLDKLTVQKVGLNTSNKIIPSNDTISLSEESVHPTHYGKEKATATATIEAVQTSALISAEERKLLDALEGSNVVSRAWTDNQRGYESNEELSTSEEVGSTSNLDDADQDFILNLGEEQIKTGKQQYTTAELLDAMLSANPLDILSRDPYSAKRGNRSRNAAQVPNQQIAGSDTFLEGEAVEGLQQIDKTVPGNATEKQQTHTKENNLEDNVRRPPMRNAKLKQAAPTTSTKSKRSKKKS